MKNKKHLLIVVLVTIIALLLLSFFPITINHEQPAKQLTGSKCQTLTTGCIANIGNTQVEIKFPQNIIFLKRFPVEVRVSETRFDKVTVDFKMVGMNMGLNFYQLKQNDEDKSLWEGQGVLPVCTTGRTDWQAIISLHQGENIDRVAFQFEVMPSVQ